jgi:hypothetical protein
MVQESGCAEAMIGIGNTSSNERNDLICTVTGNRGMNEREETRVRACAFGRTRRQPGMRASGPWRSARGYAPMRAGRHHRHRKHSKLGPLDHHRELRSGRHVLRNRQGQVAESAVTVQFGRITMSMLSARFIPAIMRKRAPDEIGYGCHGQEEGQQGPVTNATHAANVMQGCRQRLPPPIFAAH